MPTGRIVYGVFAAILTGVWPRVDYFPIGRYLWIVPRELILESNQIKPDSLVTRSSNLDMLHDIQWWIMSYRSYGSNCCVLVVVRVICSSPTTGPRSNDICRQIRHPLAPILGLGGWVKSGQTMWCWARHWAQISRDLIRLCSTPNDHSRVLWPI